MTPGKLASFAKLQQLIQHAEDPNQIIASLLPRILEELAGLGYTYHFISAVFLNPDGQIQQTYFTDSNIDKSYRAEEVFNLMPIITSGSDLQLRLIWGETIISSEMELYISQGYSERLLLKSIIFSPAFVSKKFAGSVIFASSRADKETTKEEIEMIELVTNLLSIAFKLQDTQSSLTTVTKDVYSMNLKLHQLDKLKDDFVSIASHELRTPMTAIRSYVWMALNRPDIALSDKMKKYLSRTLLSTERLINLVNDMLNVSRIEAGRIEINPEAFNIVNLAKEVMEEVKPKADEKSIHLIVLESQMPQVFGDPDKLHEVFLNLVGNALKFTPVDGSVTISFFTDGHILETSVKDTGVGISKDDQARLFRKFERLDSSYVAVSSSGGTGLGLYISKSLITLMKGEMKARSEGLGKGTTFSFSLPVASQELMAESEKYHVKPTDGSDAKGLEPVAI